jgi:Zn-dependent protease with chaperone function
MREHRSEADSLRQTGGWVDNCWHYSVPLLHNVRNMKSRFWATTLSLALIGSLASAQTRITPPGNKYKPSQDVELGRKAADEARNQLPIMHDDAVTSYVDGVGRRLVAVIPPELQHPEFQYTFEAVNVREINAFALPGGPMFVNRGMIEAANSEGEVAGVMAHELSHVILRHGTAQASKATKYEVGSLLGAIGGAIIGGGLGTVVSQGTQLGIGASFLKFGRDFEKQADIQGAQLMALAGYDAHEMANMFRTIEKQSGSNGPEWLSDHPNPGNRYEYINKEAASLKVVSPITDNTAFERVRAHLKTLPRAPTTEEATRAAKRGTSTGRTTSLPPPSGRVDPPSSRYQSYTEGNVFDISVPANWRELPDSNTVTFAPVNGYGDYKGSSVFTHGIQIGLDRNESHDLRTATDELVDALSRGNPKLSRSGDYFNTTVDGRRGLHTTLNNVSDATGRDEVIQLVTTQTRDGNLFYAVAVSPRDEADQYDTTFQRVINSIRLRR